MAMKTHHSEVAKKEGRDFGGFFSYLFVCIDYRRGAWHLRVLLCPRRGDWAKTV
jgi:hypothetical protein